MNSNKFTKAIVFAFCLIVIFLNIRIADATWYIEGVDTPPLFYDMTDRTIAITDDGVVHIAYGGDHLYYAYHDGSIWHYETVDSSPWVGSYTSLALDSQNKVHISYYDEINSDLKYATNATGSWVKETVDNTGPHTSLALDSQDKVHISYYDGINRNLKYATNATGSWVTETVDSSPWVGSYTSLALDSQDKVHISYHDDLNNKDLKYATNATGFWVTETVDSDGSTGRYTSLALDSQDRVHISYNGYRTHDLKYATNATGSWVTETVDSYEDASWTPPWFTSLAIDSQDKVHISYYYDGTTNRDLKYATNATGSWVTETVESDGDVGRYTSLAIDSQGKVHISYYDLTNNDLKYATNATGSWVTETVDSAGYVGFYTSIALDSQDKVHISYCDAFYDYPNFIFDNLKYATNSTGSWVTETVDSAGEVGWYTSLAIDSQDKVHISYYDNTNYDLKYVTNATGSWVTETVESAGDVGRYTSLALDSQNKVHISYYYETNYDLKYATNATGSWVTEIVDSAGYVGEYTSLALDSQDKVHISYYDDTNDDLKYATNTTGSWVTETVDNTYVGISTSLAIDSQDKVHISYDNLYPAYPYFGIWYATNATGSWVRGVLEMAVASVDAGSAISLALDSQGKVHISYNGGDLYDFYNDDGLKYTTNATGSWVTETVYGVSSYNSLAIDSQDKVHISYKGYGLKYASQCDVQPTTTSTITTTPTTTTTPKYPCKKIFGEDPDEVELLRYIRDNVLSQTPEGKELIKLYYQWSPTIVKAMEGDDGFKEDVKEMVDGVLGLITEEK